MNILHWIQGMREREVVAWLLGEDMSPRAVDRVKANLRKSARMRSYVLAMVRDLADIAEALGDPYALVDERVEWLYELDEEKSRAGVGSDTREGTPWWGVWASVGSGVAALFLLVLVWLVFPTLQDHLTIGELIPDAARKQDRRDVAAAGVRIVEYEEDIDAEGLWVDHSRFDNYSSNPLPLGIGGRVEPEPLDTGKKRDRVGGTDTGFLVEEGRIMRKVSPQTSAPVPEPVSMPESSRMEYQREKAQRQERTRILDQVDKASNRPAVMPESGARVAYEQLRPVVSAPSRAGEQTKRLSVTRTSGQSLPAAGLGGMQAKVVSKEGSESQIDGLVVRRSQPYRVTAPGESEGKELGELIGDLVGKDEKVAYDYDRPLSQIQTGFFNSRSVAVPQMLSVHDNPYSTFSLNVSDASFLLAQSALRNGQAPEPQTVRQEEFYNYFDYRDPVANKELPVSFFAETAQVPFLHNQQLVRFSVKTQSSGREGTKPLRLTLVLDHSGSMTRADRQEVLNAFSKQLSQLLQPGDRWSLLTFAEKVTVQQVAADAGQMKSLPQTLSQIPAEGGTNIQQALIEGYKVARSMYSKHAYNRVILITDGAANMGSDLPDELAGIVENNRKEGIYFDAIGVGWEDYNDTLLERLARNGEGKYRFIDSPEDVDPLIQSLAGSFHPAARDVKVQVEWNPNQVNRYRLIGYETHRLHDEDFRDDSVDAAEMARNEVGNALYLVETLPGGEGPLGTVNVRYKPVDEDRSKELSWVLPAGVSVDLNQASASMQLASAAAFFAETLVDPRRYPELSLEQLEQWLSAPARVYSDKKVQELLQMIQQARGIIR